MINHKVVASGIILRLDATFEMKILGTVEMIVGKTMRVSCMQGK